jgi:hypothetical protein
MKSGLWWKNGPIPLVDVMVSGKITDSGVNLNVIYKYVHAELQPLSANLEWPMDIFGAVCGFEIVSEGVKVETTIQKREGNFISAANEDLDKKYRPDIFLCSIEKVEPGKILEVHISFIFDLFAEGSTFRCIIPASVFSNSHTSSKAPTTLNVNIVASLSTQIAKIESPTHTDIKVTQKEKNINIIEFSSSDSKEDQMVLLFHNATKNHLLSSVIERHPVHQSLALRLVFRPDISDNFQLFPNPEIVALVDCGQFVSKHTMTQIKDALDLFTK